MCVILVIATIVVFLLVDWMIQRRRKRVRDAVGSDPLVMKPIGYVQTEFPGDDGPDGGSSETSSIVLDPSFAEGLRGIHVGQDILVSFWFHRSEDYTLLQHPRGDRTRQKRGVFALRSSRRPNPLGLSQVTVLAVEGVVLRVRGLDAVDGTPVLDLKPVVNPDFDNGTP